MKEIIEWLMNVEQAASRLYREAANYFDDPDFIQFLQQSADDEAFHCQVMTEALKIIDDHPEIKSVIVIDEEIKAPIESALNRARARIYNQSLSEIQMIECIVTMEYSEWNDIFLYVVNTLKKNHSGFKSVAAKIQCHLRRIEHYLRHVGHGRSKVEAIQRLKPVWTEKVLIIEDDPIITELLATVLQGEGHVDTAANGVEGLTKIRQNYYRMIISDINMPQLDGISAFKQARKEFPGIERRYLFFTGNLSKRIRTFFKTHHVKYILKPARLQEVKKHVVDAMYRIPCN